MAGTLPWPKRELKIGDVSKLACLPVKTIRFYCDQKLIQPVGRSESKHRIFDECVIEELALIKTLKVMNFGLVDIKSILEARRSGFCTCSYLKGTIKSKINSVDEKIKELQQVQGQLLSLIGNWRDCGGIKANPEASSVFVEPYTKASLEELLV